MIPGNWSHPDKYARVESERRFLVEALPAGLLDVPFVRISDLYIIGTRLRLRRIESPIGETLALKLGQKYSAANQRDWQTTMTNFYLNEDEYRVLSSLIGKTLIKRRYPYQHAGVHYSIDVFEGPLTRLILLECEGLGDNDLQSILVPAFASREVTGEIAFAGGELAKLSAEEFQQWQASWLDDG